MNPPNPESDPVASRSRLIDRVAAGWRPEFLLFWGPGDGVTLDGHLLCQWWPAPFVVGGVTYGTAEHFMMAEKARLFGDGEMRERIVAAPDPAVAKQLGRAIRGYEERAWADARFGVVVRGSLEKFRQNPALGAFLLGTGDAVLAEASPIDRIWGIGLAADHPDATDPGRWRGANLLGFALMAARHSLRGREDGAARRNQKR